MKGTELLFWLSKEMLMTCLVVEFKPTSFDYVAKTNENSLPAIGTNLVR